MYGNFAADMNVAAAGWCFGAQFGDLNNDGTLDLYLVNGYVSADRNLNYWYDFSKVAGGHEVVDRVVAVEGRALRPRPAVPRHGPDRPPPGALERPG